MNREYHQWHSPALGRTMELLVFGQTGAKVLMIPTRDGRFFEYEDLGLVGALAPKIEAGELQLYCVDSVDEESLYCGDCHPAHRIQRHEQYQEHLLSEVLPLMAAKNGHTCTIAQGCSLGAYHAADIAFRHPQLFQKLAAFSGRFDLTLNVEHFGDLFEGYYDDTVYRHTPSHFLPDEQDSHRLAALRAMDIVLAIGQEDPFLANNRQLSAVLTDKGIPNELHIWPGRAHRGGSWRRMAPLYI
ncbi:esterase family protein [Thiohalorhabdus sp.]|uniref:esterase family protein n=1 Tax=Thiohalorhabdus sp. TaxID=3094134 RepID=UPI002FC29682